MQYRPKEKDVLGAYPVKKSNNERWEPAQLINRFDGSNDDDDDEEEKVPSAFAVLESLLPPTDNTSVVPSSLSH